jgi:hypothetical protein
MVANYSRARYSTPSLSTQLMQQREAHARTQEQLKKALEQCKVLEAEVERLERELSNRGQL